ncbi:phage minor head protein [Alkalilimnicola sp. S0819]|uniref:phage head morphogenesis protein n=1 Tax=Alkalilimnicola sp. S0819 TaxID=2613922 RepID=UPI0012627BF3|nr:phage minor head protein [Alkalilimnicola sp. S0819]KAB7624332.1 head morphogenesis protein [Alkalilimnicola sp. S0819]MPQ16157.1 head morphogenesis protein [Alkalilimnicola sp. S0819]
MPEQTAPGPVPEDALAYFRAKGIRPSFDHRDVWREEHANAFTVAKAMQLDLLEDMRAAVDEALTEGRTFREFARDLTPTLQRKGWWGMSDMQDPLTGEIREVQLGSPRRLRTIYRTNLRTARDAGQWQRIERARRSHPYLIYQLGPSEAHRPEHAAWEGLMLPMDHPWWDTHAPRNGWGCKCHVRQVSRREAERLRADGNVRTEAPEIRHREWVNKRTGEVERVPEGIDPGWDTNPGKTRRAQVQGALSEKLDRADEQLAAAAVDQTVASPAFDHFLETPEGAFPIAVLPRELVERIEGRRQTALLSAETLAKQRERHPDLTTDDYRSLPRGVRAGRVIALGERQLSFFFIEGRLYKAVFKSTRDGESLYLQSYYRTNEREMRRDQRRGELVRDWEEE